jgi:hypothetical protein
VSEEKGEDGKRIEVEEFKVARYPPPDPEGRGSRILRGCGIALGIAALVFLFAVGACFIALSQW